MRVPSIENQRHLLFVLIAVSAIALIARLVFLGDRIAHWDEGRVGYDILRSMATGQWEYRPIVHGPFFPRVNTHMFELFGPSDFSARLIVAVIGGLLPLAAWLYRDYLSPRELLAVAFFLAADPIFLYYSRFMRNDVVLAAFVFVALGCFLRLIKTNHSRYLYGGVIFTALAFTTKGNIVLYVACVIGATVLLLDHRLFLARQSSTSSIQLFGQYYRKFAAKLWYFRYHLVANWFIFLTIIVYFYAPRGGAVNELDLWTAVFSLEQLPALIWTATVGSASRLIDLWVFGGMQEHAYLSFFGYYVFVLASASGAIALLAIFGFIADRYTGEQPRDIISLGFYWGVVSVVGYPLAMDIMAPWNVVHSLLPLMIPAAAGLTLIVGWGHDALGDGDQISAMLAGIIVLIVVGQIAGVAVSTSFVSPQADDNVLVQFGQPGDDMRPALDAIDRATADTEGLDVLWHGNYFFIEDEAIADRKPVPDSHWYNRLPIPWYLESVNATVTSSAGLHDTMDQLDSEQPPVIITCTGSNECPPDEDLNELDAFLDGYHEYRFLGRSHGMTFVFYIDDQYVTE